MSSLRVVVMADGARRQFRGEGDGAELVAAFRVWLSSADFWFPMAQGADEVDAKAARIEAGYIAPVLDPSAGDVVIPAPAPVPVRVDPVPPVVAVPATPIAVPDAPASAQLRAEVLRALASGASYAVREITRAMRATYPDISPDALAPVLNHLAREKRVARLSVGGGDARYQITNLGRGTK
jgi:hypothetical protein